MRYSLKPTVCQSDCDVFEGDANRVMLIRARRVTGLYLRALTQMKKCFPAFLIEFEKQRIIGRQRVRVPQRRGCEMTIPMIRREKKSIYFFSPLPGKLTGS